MPKVFLKRKPILNCVFQDLSKMMDFYGGHFWFIDLSQLWIVFENRLCRSFSLISLLSWVQFIFLECKERKHELKLAKLYQGFQGCDNSPPLNKNLVPRFTRSREEEEGHQTIRIFTIHLLLSRILSHRIMLILTSLSLRSSFSSTTKEQEDSTRFDLLKDRATQDQLIQ